MLHFFKLLFLLIDISQETVLSWFGIKSPVDSELDKMLQNNVELSLLNSNPSTDISLETFRLIIEGLWGKIQQGLTLTDIEGVLFFIVFIRFFILAIRYNLKTSVYITCVGIFAGYLWYRHLIDLISTYRIILLKLPFVHRLGTDGSQLRDLNEQIALTNLKLGEHAQWYNPGQVLLYAFTRGIVDIDPESGARSFIDPISMIIYNLNEPERSKILPLYYKIYGDIIPQIYNTCSRFWSQISSVAAYTIITRVGKRYCPYLVRWHWTCLLILGMFEPVIMYLTFRVSYFKTYVLIPQAEAQASQFSLTNVDTITLNPNIDFQIEFLNMLLAFLVVVHIGIILFSLFHAIWGQYFYFPFIVENTELHVGLRPKNSVYSGGKTSWQDKKEKARKLKNKYPKFWYGWFGHGTDGRFKIFVIFKKFILKRLKKIFKRLKRK